MSWNEYVQRIREGNSYRNRVKPKRLKKDMATYGVGSTAGSKRAQAGSPYKNVKVSFKGKGFNDISAPPGALEEVEAESFEVHDELQPEIWDEDDLLRDEVRKVLLEIAEDFLGGLEVSADMLDLRFTGSLANYNWSKYSDIDLHIVVDYSEIDDNVGLVKAFFDAARMRWNDKHQILIHGFEVEIYVEDLNEAHTSSGLYSVLEGEWLKKPEPAKREVDFETAQKKADDYIDQTDRVSTMIYEDEDYDRALRNIERIKQKIRNMRKAGLDSAEREFSAENIAFKILRRDNILQKLNDLRYDAYDSSMTINEE